MKGERRMLWNDNDDSFYAFRWAAAAEAAKKGIQIGKDVKNKQEIDFV